MKKTLFKINPRGPCAGVIRALDILDLALQKYKSPIYVNHQIVHNDFVVQEYEQKGVIFCKTPEEIPENSVYIFSAHGVSPQFKTRAKNKNLQLIDATCPLVDKVHNEAINFTKKGFHILYIGHKNHPEALGVMGISDMSLIDSIETAENIFLTDHQKNNCTILTQTTLSIDETSLIIDILQKRFPKIFISKIKDICYATQNRQDAVKENIISKKLDILLVVGSPKSSNSVRLVETAKERGCISFLIPDISHIPFKELYNSVNIGITSGASVPEKLTNSVIEKIIEKNPDISIEEISGKKENVVFQTPEI